jgi:peptide/nickel transport system permease protein
MLNYLIRRLLIGVMTLVLISFLIYGLIRHMPGTPLTADPTMMDPRAQLSDAEIKRLERLYGLDKPWYEAYWVWLGNVVRLDLGRSISQNNAPVAGLIAERLPATLLLSVSSLVLTYLLSIPIGLWSTVHAGSARERTVSTLLYML